MGVHQVEYALFALPIHDGKVATALAFLQDLEHQRKSEYAASEQRLGITKEVWAIQQTPMGDLFVVFSRRPTFPGPWRSSSGHTMDSTCGSKSGSRTQQGWI